MVKLVTLLRELLTLFRKLIFLLLYVAHKPFILSQDLCRHMDGIG